MTDTLATFADQVTTVAREVGVEGRLGGQANVARAAGTWKDLTGNVNLLAANLTTQVRAIAEVATAVTREIDPLGASRGARRGGGTQRQHQHDDRELRLTTDHTPNRIGSRPTLRDSTQHAARAARFGARGPE